MANQYTAVGGVTRAHDSNGNLTDDGTHRYLYDFKNRLVEVKLKSSGATVSTYRYDAQGRRVEKDVGGTPWKFGVIPPVAPTRHHSGRRHWCVVWLDEDLEDDRRLILVPYPSKGGSDEGVGKCQIGTQSRWFLGKG